MPCHVLIIFFSKITPYPFMTIKNEPLSLDYPNFGVHFSFFKFKVHHLEYIDILSQMLI